MARMLNAGASRWQIATPTYGYEVKANLRVREEHAWRSEWAEELDYAWFERNAPILIEMGLITEPS